VGALEAEHQCLSD
jgi:glutaredoxin 2